jgi:hypothetical protein
VFRGLFLRCTPGIHLGVARPQVASPVWFMCRAPVATSWSAREDHALNDDD